MHAGEGAHRVGMREVAERVAPAHHRVRGAGVGQGAQVADEKGRREPVAGGGRTGAVDLGRCDLDARHHVAGGGEPQRDAPVGARDVDHRPARRQVEQGGDEGDVAVGHRRARGAPEARDETGVEADEPVVGNTCGRNVVCLDHALLDARPVPCDAGRSPGRPRSAPPLHPPVSARRALTGRGEDLDRIGRLVEATAAGDGSLLLIAGPAGIGASSLLDHAVTSARAAAITTVTAASSELEQEFAFGVARRLFEPVVHRPAASDELLAGAARRAAPVLGLEHAAEPDLHATLHGLYWLLVNMSASGPVLVAVDDVQWADEPSLRWLAYAVRRLEGAPISIAVTVRTGAGAFGAALDELVAHEPAVRLAPGPLDGAAVAAVLEQQLGVTPAPASPTPAGSTRAATRSCSRSWSPSCARAAYRRTARTSPCSRRSCRIASACRCGAGSPGSTRRRVSWLTPWRCLARAVTCRWRPRSPGWTSRAPPRPPARSSSRSCSTTASELRFRHPLVRTVVEAAMPAPARVARHARAAELLAARDAPSGRIAAHLLAAGGGRGDPRAECAPARRRRGGAGAGGGRARCRAAARALDEPAPPELRPALLRELGEAELAALDARAPRTCAPRSRRPPIRARGRRSRCSSWSPSSSPIAAATRCARRWGRSTRRAGDPELREEWLKLEALLALVGRYDLTTEAELRGRIHAVAASLAGATLGERVVLATSASERPGPAAADLVRTTRQAIAVMAERPWALPADGIGDTAMLLHADHPRGGGGVRPRAGREGATADGSPTRHAYALTARGMAAFDLGDLRAAAADFDEAARMWKDLGLPAEEGRPVVGGVVGFRVVAHAEAGEFDRADALLAAAGVDGELPERMLFNSLLHARGSLALLARRLPSGDGGLPRGWAAATRCWKLRRPSPPWRSNLAVALVASGERAQARELAREELRDRAGMGDRAVRSRAPSGRSRSPRRRRPPRSRD